jgi:hypothetical protein
VRRIDAVYDRDAGVEEPETSENSRVCRSFG